MKQCPQCGFKPSLNNRKLLKLFYEHFPGLPILEMGSRGWIRLDVWGPDGKAKWNEDRVPELLAHIEKELIRFCDVDSSDGLKEIFGWAGDLMDKDTATFHPNS